MTDNPHDDNVVEWPKGGKKKDLVPERPKAEKPRLEIGPEEHYPEMSVEVDGLKFVFHDEYEPYFIQRAEQEGLSILAIAAELGVPFRIVQHWASKKKSFAIALDFALQNAQAFWESQLRTFITVPKFNVGGFMKMMAVQFPNHWREIDTAAIVSIPDPYGFTEEAEQADAQFNADKIFERLMKLKLSQEAESA